MLKKFLMFIICVLIFIPLCVFNTKIDVSSYPVNRICITSKNKTSKHLKFNKENIKTSSLDIYYPQISGLNNRNTEKKINNLIKLTAYNPTNTDIPKEENTLTKVCVDFDTPYIRNNILSIVFNRNYYLKGMINNCLFIRAINIDLNTGYIYSLDSILKKNITYEEKLNNFLKDEIANEQISLIEPFRGISDNYNFYFSDNGITFFFQEYTYTLPSQGPLKLTIPYKTLNSIINTNF